MSATKATDLVQLQDGTVGTLGSFLDSGRLHVTGPVRMHARNDVGHRDVYFADEQALYNPRLKRRYDVRDDIPVMLIDEATTVDDTEDARLLAKAETDGVRPTFEAG